MGGAGFDVAIVGGGLSGAALAVHLLRLMPAGSRLVIFDAAREVGRGLAYGTDNPDHLLNVRAGRMSLIADDMLHFTRWLVRGHGDGAKPSEIAETYVSRRLYGDYVRDSLARAVAAARGRIAVEIVEAEVRGIRPLGAGFVVETGTGRPVVAGAVALCIGNRQAGLPVPAERIAAAVADRVIADPWSGPRLKAIAADDRVLLIGTGLTMIDQVLSLRRAGHRGMIVAASRHGYLPHPHNPHRTERSTVPPPSARTSLRRLVRWVVAAARAEIAAGGDWRTVVDGLRPLTQTLWQVLSDDDHRRFFRHLDALWSVHRHRMAPSVAEAVAGLSASGRLVVLPARVLALGQSATGGIAAALRFRGSTGVAVSETDWVINCAGVRPATAGPLVQRMRDHGLCRPDRLGRGLDVDARSRLVGPDGLPIRGLFALGPLTAGRFLEITAVPDIRDQCAAVAEELARLAPAGRDRVGPAPARTASSPR